MKARTHARLHRLILSLYPREFRAEFGEEISADFEQRLIDSTSPSESIRFWWREIAQLPQALSMAYTPISQDVRADRRIWVLLTIAACALVAAGVASHQIAHAGLYYRISQIALMLGLVLTGVILGVLCLTRSSLQVLAPAALGIALVLGAPWALDRHLVANYTLLPASADLPGVRVDASAFPSDAEARTFIQALTTEGTPRVRTESRSSGSRTVVTVLRSGGVDGAYGLGALLIILAPTITIVRRGSRAIFSHS